MENNINLANTPWSKCECGNTTFRKSMMFKRLSPLMSPSGREEFVPVEICICESCNKIPGFLANKIPDLPEELRAIEITKEK